MTRNVLMILSIACLLFIAEGSRADEGGQVGEALTPTAATEGLAANEPSRPAEPVASTGSAPAPAVSVTSPEAPAAQTCLSNDGSSPLAFPKPNPNDCSAIGPCSQWNSSYCSYSCSGFNCCKAVVLIPGSFCPKICA